MIWSFQRKEKNVGKMLGLVQLVDITQNETKIMSTTFPLLSKQWLQCIIFKTTCRLYQRVLPCSISQTKCNQVNKAPILGRILVNYIGLEGSLNFTQLVETKKQSFHRLYDCLALLKYAESGFRNVSLVTKIPICFENSERTAIPWCTTANSR